MIGTAAVVAVPTFLGESLVSTGRGETSHQIVKLRSRDRSVVNASHVGSVAGRWCLGVLYRSTRRPLVQVPLAAKLIVNGLENLQVVEVLANHFRLGLQVDSCYRRRGGAVRGLA